MHTKKTRFTEVPAIGETALFESDPAKGIVFRAKVIHPTHFLLKGKYIPADHVALLFEDLRWATSYTKEQVLAKLYRPG